MNDPEVAVALAPAQLERLPFCACHLSGSAVPLSLGWAWPHYLHQSQYPELAGPGFSELSSLAGWPAPLPPSCFEAAHHHPRQGCWVMWSGGFRVTPPPSSSATHPGHSHRVCAKNTHSPGPSRPRSPYLHPLIGIHFAALDQLDAERLFQGPQGHRGGLGGVEGRSGGVKAGEFRGGLRSRPLPGRVATAVARVLQIPARNAILYQKTCRAGAPGGPRPPERCRAWSSAYSTGDRRGRRPSARPRGCPRSPDRSPPQPRGLTLNPEQPEGMRHGAPGPMAGPGRCPIGAWAGPQVGRRAAGEGKCRAPAHLLQRNGGRFGAWLLDLGGGVALLVPHGEDGRGVHHGQVGGQPAVQAAADVLRWGAG